MTRNPQFQSRIRNNLLKQDNMADDSTIKIDRKIPVKLNKLLNKIFRQKNWDQRLGLHELFRFWDDTVGKEIATQAQPSHIRGNVLWVAVTEPVWMQQLHLQKILLLEKINDRLGKDKLSDIRFKLDTALKPAQPPAWLTAIPAGRPVMKKPDPEKMREFEDLTSSLKSDEIKTSLRHLWEIMHSCR